MYSIVSTSDWAGRAFERTGTGLAEAVSYIEQLDNAGASGIYLRMTSIAPLATSEARRRGSVSDSVSLPCLWADLDMAGPGHKHNHPSSPAFDPSKPVMEFPLPPNEDEAYRIIARVGLPDPTCMVHSGGGLYPIWLFQDPPYLTTADKLEKCSNVSKKLQALIGWSANDLQYHYGTGVSDLARVLRIPGTLNRKTPESPQPCRILSGYAGGSFRYAEFAELVDRMAGEFMPKAPARPVTSPPVSAAPGGGIQWGTETGRHVITDDTPLNTLEAELDWPAILEPAGWVLHHAAPDGTLHWTRPGKDRRDGWSATTGRAADRDRMFCFSDAAGLPTQESMTKGFVYAALYCGGDLSRAARTYADRCAARTGGGTTLRPTRPAAGTPEASAPQTNGPIEVLAKDRLPGRDEVEAAEPWAPPRRIVGSDLLPEFPLDCLPGVMRDMVMGVTEEMGLVDPTLPAIYALGAVSALVAPRVAVRLGGWVETTNLYVIASLGPGERKSPSLKPFIRPLRDIQRRQKKEHIEKCELEICKLREGGDGLKGAVSANRLEDQISKLEESKGEPPMVLIASDTTPEATTWRLHRNGGHGAIMDAEGTITSAWTGRYSGGDVSGLEVFLQGYGGELLSVERKGSGISTVQRPIITICSATQPEVIAKIAAKGAIRERGLAGRIIWAFPKSRIGANATSGPRLDDHTKRAWALLLEGISEMEIPDEEVYVEDMPSLVFSPEAKVLSVEYEKMIEESMARSSLYDMRDWASKHCGRLHRIAALLHIADGGTLQQEISRKTVEDARKICDWAIAHAKYYFLCLVSGGEEDASDAECLELLELIKRHKLLRVTVREMKKYARYRSWAKGKGKVEDAADHLIEFGYLRAAVYLDRAGRQRTIYLVNPLDVL